MREARRSESEGEHDHEIGERRDALMLETHAFHAITERGDCRGVCLQAAIDALVFRGHP